MLSKKITVQKSFRIEANMENDLELLSQKAESPAERAGQCRAEPASY